MTDAGRTGFFAVLLEDELARLKASLHHIVVPAGTLLMREGDPSDGAYLILSGEMEVIRGLGTPEEAVLHALEPGETIGEMSLLNPGQTRSASVRAVTDCEVLALTPADFDALLSLSPTMGYELAREMSQRLRESDSATIRDLRQKNQALTEAYQALQAAQAQIIEKEAMERELAVARQIQTSMLPRHAPSLPGFDFGMRILPARQVGGDLYDFIPLDKDRVGIVAGDVCGKGVPSALVMAMTRSILRTEARRRHSPAKTLAAVNRNLLEMNDSGLFVTVLYGILDRTTRQFVYVRAAHETPVLLTAEGEVAQAPPGIGQPLGILDAPEMDEQTLVIPPGGTLLLHSDGVPDAVNPAEEAFGYARLRDAVAAAGRGLAAQALCDTLIDILVAYRGSAAQYDDITLVAVRAHDVDGPPSRTLEEAYGSVQPLNRPEDFNDLRDKAREERALEKRRALRKQAARMWRDRTDLPNFEALRRELDSNDE